MNDLMGNYFRVGLYVETEQAIHDALSGKGAS
jgi:hypothetical protein